VAVNGVITDLAVFDKTAYIGTSTSVLVLVPGGQPVAFGPIGVAQIATANDDGSVYWTFDNPGAAELWRSKAGGIPAQYLSGYESAVGMAMDNACIYYWARIGSGATTGAIRVAAR
jgi:hypothetical protein